MTSTIGIVSTVQDVKFFTQGYFRTILSAAGARIAGYDCTLRLVSLTHAEFRSHESARALLEAQQCNAALVVAPHDMFLPTIIALCANLPAIIISPPRLAIPVSYVCSDNRGAAREVVAHLVSRGRRRIVLIQPDIPSGDFEERERGYREGAEAAGIAFDVFPLSYPITDAQIDQVLRMQPDAVIAPSDDDALPVLGRMRRHGIRVPQDMALTGFDDEDFAADTSPPLTTVRQPIAVMAERATAYLIDRLAGVDRGVYQETLPNTMIVRGST